MILKNCTVQQAIDVLQSLPKNQQFVVSFEIETKQKNENLLNEDSLIKKITQLIANHGTISHRDISTQITSTKRDYLPEILNDLIKSGKIIKYIEKSSNGKQVTFYQLA